MGLFDLINGKKEYLLNWQRLVLTNSPNKLIMTEQQLNAITKQQADRDLEIIRDCAKLVEQTKSPDVFFMRLNLLIKKLSHLASLEKYITISIPGTSITAACYDVARNYQEEVKKFLVRYFSDTFDKAEAMKTEKGRIGKYQKFYDSLQEYYRYMNAANIDYVETKYKAYTRP